MQLQADPREKLGSSSSKPGSSDHSAHILSLFPYLPELSLRYQERTPLLHRRFCVRNCEIPVGCNDYELSPTPLVTNQEHIPFDPSKVLSEHLDELSDKLFTLFPVCDVWIDRAWTPSAFLAKIGGRDENLGRTTPGCSEYNLRRRRMMRALPSGAIVVARRGIKKPPSSIELIEIILAF
ncbi:uncharacterized protein EI90DRAFT_3121516 [Cantharellus anzutake]|uniref:uncharacterized protein n=1 Tax=Cantharellus anzutake TaxID=1750568 RepID=UPI001908FBA1|nr:uncharacterized protein EI90DRAFT_3121516 [Cantharellus anzutake]KAF8334175.1 hypothetical protein EI90DRAFT_3121516 [Cantharellus anzutake]